MKRTNKFQITRLSLLLLGVMVFWILSSAFFSSQAQAIGDAKSVAPVNDGAQTANIVNPRPQAASWSFDLCASDGSITLPDSSSVIVWGFVDTGGGTCTTGLVTSLPGPELRVTAGDSVTITLTNALAENVSILIAGQNLAASGGVAGLFATEAAANGGTVTYDFTAQEGTYLYESGSNPSIQIPMGLYGALIVDSGVSGQAYGEAFDQEAVLLLSEIDPALNANPGGFDLLDYHPTYWLINGKSYPATANITSNPGDQVLLRYLNAGFDHPSMAFLGGYQTVFAKDGYPLANAFDVTAEIVPAGTTADMIVDTTGLEGSFPLYNRNMYVTNGDAFPGGMLTFIEVAAPVGNPPTVNIVSPANGSTVSGGAVSVQIDANDADDGVGTLTVEWNVDGGTWQSATWVNPYYEASWDSMGVSDGAHTFNARVTDSDTNIVSANNAVNVDNNTPPTALDDGYLTNEDTSLLVAAPGVLTNDNDTDGDSLTAVLTTLTSNGTTTLNADGSFSYIPNTNFNGSDSFTYYANDGTEDSNVVTVSITVNPVNDNPVAVDDNDTTRENIPITIDVLANDTDVDGDTLSTDSVTDGSNGTVTINPDLTVTYTPNANFTGNDSFSYAISDGNGGTDTGNVFISVTTGGVIAMHITELSGSVTNTAPGGSGGGTYSVSVIITVHDAVHDPLGGVTVSGSWTTNAGGFTVATNSCVTNVSGQCTVQAVHNLNPNNAGNNLTFTVNNLTLNGYIYVPADNEVPGNSVTVQRP